MSERLSGDDACLFFERYLRHVEGEWAGRRFELSGWQRDFVRNVFGTKLPSGLRQYRTAYLEVPRKNGKSTLAAGIALLLLFADREPGAQIYSAAGDRAQASIVFSIAKRMVEQSPVLSAHCKIYKKRIVVEQTGSFYEAISAEAYSKHGFNAHGVIFDELHVQPNRELWDVLETSMGAREQPLMLAITTAGFDRKSICFEKHDYARKVISGTVIDPTFFGSIYAADDNADWSSPSTWAAANPGYDVSVKADYFRTMTARAQESPALENTFRRLHLNQWTEQDVRWLSMNVWRENGGAFDASILDRGDCFAGLDLSSTTDLSALVLCFPRDDVTYLLPTFFVPSDNMALRERRDRVPYSQWVRDGAIIATEGNVVDYDVIRQTIHKLGDRYRIRKVAIDRWNATQISTQLVGDGLDVVGFGQGFASMSAPTKEFEARLLGRKLRHGGHPVLEWCASNVSVEMDAAGNMKPSKRKSTERIDGIVASVMALGLSMTEPIRKRSIYATRGVIGL